jgi:hypothetical protein
MISTIVGLVIATLVIIIGHLTGALDFRAAVEIMLERLEDEDKK